VQHERGMTYDALLEVAAVAASFCVNRVLDMNAHHSKPRLFENELKPVRERN